MSVIPFAPEIVADDDAYLRRPPLAARISHRLARHLPLHPMRMRGGPILSLTFDDVPDSALTEGAAILDAHKVRGTFYIAGGMLAMQMADWRMIDAQGVCELHARGHEIGCHSFSHRRADWGSAGFIAADVARNHKFLRGIERSLPLENFAYPFGYTSFTWKLALARRFRSCRGILPGQNAGVLDPDFLKSVPLYSDRIDESAIDRALDDAGTRQSWLVLFTHDVTRRPSQYGCTPALLEHTLRAAEARGIPCLNIAEALAKISAS